MKLSPELTAKILAQAGAPKPRRKPAPKQMVGRGVRLVLTVPCVVVSEMNRRDHWAARRKRFDGQANEFWATVRIYGIDPPRGLRFVTRPLTVTFTRIGGRTLDSDNLASAFKGLRDAVAAWCGLDDGDKRVTWRYAQEPGTAQGVRIELETQ